jgi:putative hemolysin
LTRVNLLLFPRPEWPSAKEFPEVEQISTEMLVLVLLILFNGSLAMAEMSLVASRRVKLEQRAAQGQRGAQRALSLLEDPTHLLSSVQVGITMVGILTGVVGGAAVADEFTDLAASVPVLAPYSRPIGIGIVVLIITYFSIVFGELLPKRLALTRPDAFASALAGPLWLLSRFTAPLVWVLTWSTNTLLRVTGLSLPDEPVLVDEEIRSILNEGQKSGTVEVTERKMVESVLRLDDLRVGAILTPRTEIEWIDLDQPVAEARELIESTGHTMYPAARGELDDIAGYLRSRDVLASLLDNQAVALESLVRDAPFVPEATSALRALEILKEKRKPALFVVDEYGGLVGMVTLSDIMRAIVGDVPDSPEEDEPMIRARADGSLLVDGLVSINDFAHSLPFEVEPALFDSPYHTMGGFVMEKLGRVPITGDTFQWQGLEFEVMDTDDRRVDKILVSRAKNGDTPEEPEATETPVA